LPLLSGTNALSIVVVGSVVSTVHVNDAGVESLFPTASTALTWNVCSPSERPVMCLGEEQLAEENAAPSSEHSNGVVGCSPLLSAPENVNLIELNDVLLPPVMAVPPTPLGTVALFIVVVGSPVSTVHVNDAGVESLFPTASTALTWNVCSPSERPVMSIGEEHPVVVNAPPSSEHSNGVVGCSPEPPALSAPENVNLIELNDVLLPPVMAVPPAPLGTVALFIVVV